MSRWGSNQMMNHTVWISSCMLCSVAAIDMATPTQVKTYYHQYGVRRDMLGSTSCSYYSVFRHVELVHFEVRVHTRDLNPCFIPFNSNEHTLGMFYLACHLSHASFHHMSCCMHPFDMLHALLCLLHACHVDAYLQSSPCRLSYHVCLFLCQPVMSVAMCA
jgi:hypothetical protein